MSTITKDQVIELAKQCFDPEIPVNIWDLGLIYDIDIKPENDAIHIRMSLTAQACPAAQAIPDGLKQKLLSKLPVKDVQVQLVFDPPWTPERISAEGRKQLGITDA